MPAADDLSGPVSYAAGWWWLAGGLLAAALVWNLALVVWGRHPRRVRREPGPARRPPATLRACYLGLLDEVRVAHATGELGPREAHQRVSALTRRFVEEMSGERTTAMTLAQLRGSSQPVLVDAIALAYPGEFAPDAADTAYPEEPGGLDEVLERARRVVEASWT